MTTRDPYRLQQRPQDRKWIPDIGTKDRTAVIRNKRNADLTWKEAFQLHHGPETKVWVRIGLEDGYATGENTFGVSTVTLAGKGTDEIRKLLDPEGFKLVKMAKDKIYFVNI